MVLTVSAIVPCIVLAIIWLDLEFQKRDVASKRSMSIFLSAILCIQMCFMFFQGYTYWGGNGGLHPGLVLGHKNMFHHGEAKQGYRSDGIQKEDLVALDWIRVNTPKDSVVLSDRSVITGMTWYMCYGAFCERQMYLEGDVYYRQTYVEERTRMAAVVRGVFENSSEALASAIDDGVDYIVQTVWLTPDFTADEQKLTLVFSSETINVYEVVK